MAGDPRGASPGRRRDHRATWIALVLLAAVPPGRSRAADPQPVVGDRVILRSARVPLRIGRRTVTTGGSFHRYRVACVRDDWLWVVAGGRQGWVRRGDVLRLDRAIAYYTDAIRRHPDAAWA